jgi:hypothetical protein
MITVGRSLCHSGSRPATGSTARQPRSPARGCWRGSSSTEEIIRQGPHHAAQKSTTTGTDAVVSAANVSAVRVDDPRQRALAPRASRDSLGDRTDTIARVTGREANDDHHHQGRTRPSRSRLAPPDQPLEGARGRIPAATRRTCVKRSIETTRTSCSTRSTPRARTRHITPRAPLRAHLRRRRDSHPACSRTRARWRPS